VCVDEKDILKCNPDNYFGNVQSKRCSLKSLLYTLS